MMLRYLLRRRLNVSIDHLLVEGIPRGPLHSTQDVLGDLLAAGIS